ncbi:DUF4878 domain-containing protein [Glycomyces sp. NPDC046736]|uniref:Rv0361 family membrane protein n=1 Tax=Glycomyces sp. NPDC046736 TaxID=3155615 RepID=UPI0033E145B4
MSINVNLRRATAVTGGAFALALALAACGSGNDSPEGAVENFLDNGAEDLVNAMLDGDAEKAGEIAEEYACAEDADSMKEAATLFADLSEEERKEAIDMAGDSLSKISDVEYEIGDVKEEDDTATVEVSITVDGDTTDETIDLVKEDDAWKICGYFA